MARDPAAAGALRGARTAEGETQRDARLRREEPLSGAPNEKRSGAGGSSGPAMYSGQGDNPNIALTRPQAIRPLTLVGG